MTITVKNEKDKGGLVAMGRGCPTGEVEKIQLRYQLILMVDALLNMEAFF